MAVSPLTGQVTLAVNKLNLRKYKVTNTQKFVEQDSFIHSTNIYWAVIWLNQNKITFLLIEMVR